MNTVWIVLKNDEVDEVFSSREAAEQHVKALINKWNRAKIVEKELKEI